MQDRFLPLANRKELIEEIEILKKDLPIKAVDKKFEKKEFNSTLFFQLLSIGISVIGVIIGILSYFQKFRKEKEKQEEIDNQMLEEENLELSFENAYEYEKSIFNITISAL